MKLYAYRRAGKIELETCQLPPEAHVTDIGTIEVTEPKKRRTISMSILPDDQSRGINHYSFSLGCDAENIIITYEVEE